MKRTKIVNGFQFIEGNWIEELENENPTIENGRKLVITEAEIQLYDEDGIYFSPLNENCEVYLEYIDGSREYWELER